MVSCWLGLLALCACSETPSPSRSDHGSPGIDAHAVLEGGVLRDAPPTGDGQRPADSAPRPDGAPGNPNGKCPIPPEAQAESSASATTVVGDGTPASCTSAAFVSAVAKGGIITFNCGPAPVTIKLTETAKIFNDKGPKIVIDGGGKVTLDGGGKVRILYQNTCDQAQKWTTSHCNDQDHPQLTVQNLAFVGGNAKGLTPNGGGAIFVRGGRMSLACEKVLSRSPRRRAEIESQTFSPTPRLPSLGSSP